MTGFFGSRRPAFARSSGDRDRVDFLRFAALFLVSLLSTFPSAAQDQEKLYALYQKATTAQQAGDLRSAAASYEEIVRLSPNLAEAHANLGSIYYELRDDDKALAALERAIKLKPELAAPHFFLGVISSRRRDYVSAIERLQTAAKLDPRNLVVQVYLGAAYFAVNDYPRAARAFEASTALPDFRVDAYYHLSKAYGEISKSLLAKLAREHTQSHYFYLAQGRFHESRRSWQAAEEAYQAALASKPEALDVEARLEWVRDQIEAGGESQAPPPSFDDDEGATMLAYLYDPPPDSAVERLLSAKTEQLAQVSGAPGDAAALYRRAEEYQLASYLAARWISAHDPESYRGHQLQAQLHESRGETDEAVREYRRAAELKPDLQNVRFAAGSLYWSEGRLEEALVELEAELAINPNHPEAHYEIADILRSFGRDEEAREHLQECLRLRPDMLDAHLAIERIYFLAGDFDKALAHLQEASRIAPADPTPPYRMAAIYRKLGKAEEARAALERFRDLKGP